MVIGTGHKKYQKKEAVQRERRRKNRDNRNGIHSRKACIKIIQIPNVDKKRQRERKKGKKSCGMQTLSIAEYK